MNDEREYDPSHLTPEERAEYDAIPDDFEFEILVEEDETPSAAEVPTDVLRKIKSSRMMTVTRLFELPPPEWFIDNLIPSGPRTLLHGPGGSKKSFLVLDWMLCAATETPWHGRDVAPGRVLYIVGEGVAGIGKRIKAWLHAHPDAPADLPNIVFMPSSINLFTLTSESHRREVDLWRRVFTTMGFRYIVIDTVHQSMAGGEENSATDIGKVLEVASKIAGQGDDASADLILVHHDPKVREGGVSSPRGSSALRDSVDVCLQVEAVKDQPLAAVLKADKVRDAEAFRPQHLRFAKHGEGVNESLYLASVDDGKPRGEMAERITRSEDQRRVLAFLKDKRRRSAPPKSKTALAKAVGGRYGDTARAVQELLDDGAIAVIEGAIRLAPAPGES